MGLQDRAGKAGRSVGTPDRLHADEHAYAASDGFDAPGAKATRARAAT